MSLRNQFIVSVLLALFISLSFLAVMASWHARLSVQNELRVALMASDRIVKAALAAAAPDVIDAELHQVVEGFNGNRHIRVELLSSDGRVIETSRVAGNQRHAPGWFEAALQIPASTNNFPIAGGRSLLLTTDPGNEIGEVWGQFRDGAAILALFGLVMMGLLHLLMSRLAAPLGKLAKGFEAVGGGDYAVRLDAKGPSETSRLAQAFNRMTERLGRLEDANRRLNTQMATIQEEERADLARDLHDEMGPFLFSMRVDAETISAEAKNKNLPVIAARARSIGEAVMHIQSQVRLILKQLRPGDVGAVGLAGAIANLAAFWERYHVGVKIHIDIAEIADGFGEQVDGTIYRLVQESLTNAVRHGGAREVSVAITSGPEGISVHIEDNGAGLNDNAETGMGLRGMRERVAALGGTLTFGNRSGGSGAVVNATLPQIKLKSSDLAGEAA